SLYWSSGGDRHARCRGFTTQPYSWISGHCTPAVSRGRHDRGPIHHPHIDGPAPRDQPVCGLSRDRLLHLVLGSRWCVSCRATPDGAVGHRPALLRRGEARSPRVISTLHKALPAAASWHASSSTSPH